MKYCYDAPFIQQSLQRQVLEWKLYKRTRILNAVISCVPGFTCALPWFASSLCPCRAAGYQKAGLGRVQYRVAGVGLRRPPVRGAEGVQVGAGLPQGQHVGGADL